MMVVLERQIACWSTMAQQQDDEKAAAGDTVHPIGLLREQLLRQWPTPSVSDTESCLQFVQACIASAPVWSAGTIDSQMFTSAISALQDARTLSEPIIAARLMGILNNTTASESKTSTAARSLQKLDMSSLAGLDITLLASLAASFQRCHIESGVGSAVMVAQPQSVASASGNDRSPSSVGVCVFWRTAALWLGVHRWNLSCKSAVACVNPALLSARAAGDTVRRCVAAVQTQDSIGCRMLASCGIDLELVMQSWLSSAYLNVLSAADASLGALLGATVGPAADVALCTLLWEWLSPGLRLHVLSSRDLSWLLLYRVGTPAGAPFELRQHLHRLPELLQRYG